MQRPTLVDVGQVPAQSRLAHYHSVHIGQRLLSAFLMEQISPITLKCEADIKKLTIASENCVLFQAHTIVPDADFLSGMGFVVTE